jgi:predicted acyltransferase
MATGNRLASLDAFRGFVILAMIWVNYIAGMPGIPCWLEHAGPLADGVTAPDLVFPAFLLMAGMAIPLALRRDAAQGLTWTLAGRLAWRAGSLMVAGVVMANAWRYDEAAALMPRALYFTLFYAAMLLLWRQAPAGAPRWPAWLGGALMLALLPAFRGRVEGEFTSAYLQHGWWGIPGMIGWAYLVCCLLFLAVRGHGAALWCCMAALLALYMAGTSGWLPMPDALNGIVNVPQVLGSTAANMMAGVLAGRVLAAPQLRPASAMAPLTAMAAGWLAAGLLLRPWYGINKMAATAPYSLLCSGIALAVFALCYWLCDVKGWRGWCAWVLPAGGNALFAYIAPDVLEQLAALLHAPRFWWPYWQTGGVAGLLNAAGMALAMMGFTALATRWGWRLKM